MQNPASKVLRGVEVCLKKESDDTSGNGVMLTLFRHLRFLHFSYIAHDFHINCSFARLACATSQNASHKDARRMPCITVALRWFLAVLLGLICKSGIQVRWHEKIVPTILSCTSVLFKVWWSKCIKNEIVMWTTPFATYTRCMRPWQQELPVRAVLNAQTKQNRPKTSSSTWNSFRLPQGRANCEVCFFSP